MTIERTDGPNINFDGPDAGGCRVVEEYHMGVQYEGPNCTGRVIGVMLKIPIRFPSGLQYFLRFRSRRAVDEFIESLQINAETAWPKVARRQRFIGDEPPAISE